MSKEVTIYDIAEKLSLSPATVSRALKDHPAVKKSTRKRVADAAKALGYRSNNFASNLRSGHTRTIGVIVHELHSNFITSVLAGIEKVTAEAGYDLIITHSSESFTREAANAHNLFHKRVDGLLASLSFETTDLAHFDPFTDKHIPIVFFDRVEPQSNQVAVVIDNYKSGYQATAHLAAQGCTRIALVTANLQRNVYAERYRGYRDALRDQGLPFSPDRVLVNDLSEEAAIDSARKLLEAKERPDGIFITNDFSAAVVMRTLRQQGIRIPEDIAIVGFNNDVIGTLIEPALSTIRYPGQEMGEVAATTLVNHLKGVADMLRTPTIVIRSELIIRASSTRRQPAGRGRKPTRSHK